MEEPIAEFPEGYVEPSYEDLERLRELRRIALDALTEIGRITAATLQVEIAEDGFGPTNCFISFGGGDDCVMYCDPPGICAPCPAGSSGSTPPPPTFLLR
ncbi:MAG TPA: hypothetical protein VNA20_16175 [Frankiaceae bacterium]|nr:hypothetical protein [Frankiaceae bacterium]